MGEHMKRNWSDDELAAQWSLSPEELALLPNHVGHNRFGFAVQLKFFEIEGRFPRSPREVPAAALWYLAGETCARLDALLQPTGSAETANGDDGDEEPAVVASLFSQLKTDPCANSCGARRSGSKAPSVTAIPTMIYPPISIAGVPHTTMRSSFRNTSTCSSPLSSKR